MVSGSDDLTYSSGHASHPLKARSVCVLVYSLGLGIHLGTFALAGCSQSKKPRGTVASLTRRAILGIALLCLGMVNLRMGMR